MIPKKVPYLCGGILFTLIIQARKTRTKARDKFHSGSDGLKDTDVMMGLVKVVTGDSFSSTRGNTFGKCTTQFKTCQDYGNTYIPFTNTTVISSFNSSLNKKDPDLLNRMSEFISTYINDVRSEWLVKALFEVIQNDVDIPAETSFYISSEKSVTKNELENASEVELPIFMLSVLYFILNEKKDNSKGRPTFEAWHTQNGPKSPWRFISDIGNSANHTIVVKNLFGTTTENVNVSEYSISVRPPKTATEKINDKICAAGQALADTWSDAVEKLADELDNKKNTGTPSISFPEKQFPEEYPYSLGDKLLLQDFTADYDEIMLILIGENYAVSLVDMSLPCKIKNLYESKWISKADDFLDPSLKSYVFGLLGELNNISNGFLVDGSVTPSFGGARTKIRNLYVKLHPDQFSGAFPYDAFIDDWNDGEY